MNGYQGETRDGVPHGKGAMTWPDGNRCEGEWCDGEPASGAGR